MFLMSIKWKMIVIGKSDGKTVLFFIPPHIGTISPIERRWHQYERQYQKQPYSVPIWLKTTLTIREAAEYSNIEITK